MKKGKSKKNWFKVQFEKHENSRGKFLTPSQKPYHKWSQTFKFYIKNPDANESQSQFTTNNK